MSHSSLLRAGLAVFLGLVLASVGHTQALSLREAVDRAIAASFLVEEGELQLTADRVALRTTQLGRYPNLSIGGSAGYQFGRTIDPVTNDFVSQEIGTNTWNINAAVPLYQGGLIRRTIKQNRARIAASEASAEDIRQDVALAAAQAYLNVLLTTEAAQIIDSRLVQGDKELARIDALVVAGQLPPADRFEPASVLANTQRELVVARNAVQSARLSLRQLLRTPPGDSLTLPPPDASYLDAVALPAVNPGDLYVEAVSDQPAVRAATLREEAAEAGVAVARAGYLPTVGAFGQLRTNASTQAFSFPVFTGGTTIVNQTFFIDGQPVTVGVPQPEQLPSADPTYFDQLSENFGQSVGLQLNVPVFNNGQTRAAVERAELEVVRARLSSERERQEFENDVQQAYQAAVAARAEVAAAREALAAARTAADAARRRAELGAGSPFELTNAQALLAQAETTLLRARYQFLFNAKVVDFYLGNPLTLD